MERPRKLFYNRDCVFNVQCSFCFVWLIYFWIVYRVGRGRMWMGGGWVAKKEKKKDFVPKCLAKAHVHVCLKKIWSKPIFIFKFVFYCSEGTLILFVQIFLFFDMILLLQCFLHSEATFSFEGTFCTVAVAFVFLSSPHVVLCCPLLSETHPLHILKSAY